MTEPLNSWCDTDTDTLILLHRNLRQGLQVVADHIEAGTFHKIPPNKSSPPSQSGQLTVVLLRAVEAELARRSEPQA
jgi:hypothetical protein